MARPRPRHRHHPHRPRLQHARRRPPRHPRPTPARFEVALPPPDPQTSRTPAFDEHVVLLCPNCGAASPTDARLCRACYSDLEGVAPVDASLAPVPARRWLPELPRTRRGWLVTAAVAIAILILAFTLRARLSGPPPPFPPVLASRTVAVTSEVWPLPNGGLAGTRTTAAMPVLEGEPAWSWTASSLPTTSLVAAADTAYLGLTDGVLVAIALDSGEERWRVPVPGLLESAPAVVDDRLYVGYRPGRLAALDRETGDTLWEADLGISISTTPVVVDGIVFVAANGLLAAFDAEDGAPIWRQSLSDTLVPVTPAIDDDTLAVATYDRVLIFDRSNGQQLTWVKLAPQHAPISAVAIIEDRIIVTANGQTLAIDEDMRRPWWDPIRPAWEFLHIVGAAPNPPWRPDLWTVALPANAYPAVVTSDVVTIATPSGALRAYDLQTGILRWESESEPVSAAPLGTPRGLLIAGLDTLRLLNSEGGTELSRISLDESPSSVVVVEWGAVVLSPGGVRAYLR